MKVAVFGTFCLDEIHLPDGKVVRDLGGLAYSVGAMAALVPRVEVRPVANVGRDALDRTVDFLKRFPNVNRSWLNPVDDPNNRVRLRYSADLSRTEEQMCNVRPFSETMWGAADGCDAVLFNFISGMEADARGPADVSRRTRFLFCDLHSYTLGPAGDGPRKRRIPPDWEELVSSCTVVQLNREELTTLCGGTLPSGGVVAGSRKVLALGPESVYVTDGGRGAWLMRSDEQGAVWPTHRKSEGDVAAVDPTGCGDVFGAAVFASLVSGGDPVAALEVGVKAGAFAAGFSGPSGLSKLRALEL